MGWRSQRYPRQARALLDGTATHVICFGVRFRFDAYGRYQLVVERHGDVWRVLQIGADGKRMERADLAIPPEYGSAEEVGEFLDVLLHESARPGRSLRLLSGN